MTLLIAAISKTCKYFQNNSYGQGRWNVGWKRYVCEKCSLVFKHKEMHRRHMNFHAEKFKCHTCGKYFQSNYYLISSDSTSGSAAAS